MDICDRYCKYFTTCVLKFLMVSLCRVYGSVANLTREELNTQISLFECVCSYGAHKNKSLISRINGHNTSFLISLCKTWFIHVVSSSNLQHFSFWGPEFWQQEMSSLLSHLSIMKSWVVLSPICLLLCHLWLLCSVTSPCSSTIHILCLVPISFSTPQLHVNFKITTLSQET